MLDLFHGLKASPDHMKQETTAYYCMVERGRNRRGKKINYMTYLFFNLGGLLSSCVDELK